MGHSLVQRVAFPNSDCPYVDAVLILSCVPSYIFVHSLHWSCYIDPTPSPIDPTPIYLIYFHRLHCSCSIDLIPTIGRLGGDDSFSIRPP